jgi:predicted alpha/beta superfamily hydrolase
MKTVNLLILIFYINVLSAQTQNSNPEITPKSIVLGEVQEIESSILKEKRIVNIYLPEGYNSKDSLKYPVIYLLDGAVDEDFIHVVGLVQFCSFEWVNQIPKSIVVGVTTADRRRDYTFPTSIQEDKIKYPSSGHSEEFILFIEKELQPCIEQKYLTNNRKTLIGQSLGGLLATEILIKKPQLFNNYIIVSPSIWWNNASILNQTGPIFNNTFYQNVNIYIGVGKEGLTPTQIPRVMEVDANLLSEKLNAANLKNVKVFFDYLPNKNHATILHQAITNAFEVLFQEIGKK